MKKIILFLALAMFISPAHASKEEKANALMKAMNVEATLNVAYDQALIPLSCQFVMTPVDEAAFKTDFIKAVDAESFVKELSQFWLQNFTEQELDDMLKFYRTPTGKKSIALMPEYTKYMLTEQKKWGEKIMPKLIELGQRISEKYQQRSGTEAAACIKQKQGQ